ncbi:unnamed protein product [Kluyveromyces dobzhanskii CBS 2104]|uniref:WGS project CCBQ000000000 data, contig 00102 n=1 Tax=Kluyveromyces dobzhanskii CBS 2104 TaxID=1427455 RepID=A0A0A8L4E0_9SACH|nr:unnamed protein product [Kluyveromyces dobzhanskii CBS 2104]
MDLLDDDDYGSVSETESVDQTVREEGPERTGSDLGSVSEVVSGFQPKFWRSGADLDGLIQVAKHENLIRDAMTSESNNGDAGADTVVQLGQLVSLIDEELSLVFQCLADTYRARFPGLETLVPERKQYVEVVKILTRAHDVDVSKMGLDQVLSKEETLVVSMTIKTGFMPAASVDEAVLLGAIRWFDRLYALLEDVSQYVEARIRTIAPNLCALVGPETATKMVAHHGSVRDLSVVPSCNLPSVGQRKTLNGKTVDISGVRQRGYLFYTDLVQTQPPEFQKQALRIVAAKVSLAARADCAASNGNCNSDLGNRWRHEIIEKLAKIVDPPNIGNVKPLPVPEDAVKKKRAGRRFRKYKEQFKMSHLRQMQNRMEFGKEEQTTLDPYGEEIGFGMANSRNAIALSSSFNNKTKMRKGMRSRLAQETKNTHDFLSDERSETLKRGNNL